jgi:hypothetical protein
MSRSTNRVPRRTLALLAAAAGVWIGVSAGAERFTATPGGSASDTLVGPDAPPRPTPLPPYRPLEKARALEDVVVNLEAPIPPQCYTRTDGMSNPCWTCHTQPVAPNFMYDWDLQEEYAFSAFGLTNRWSNLFADRSARIDQIRDETILDYIRARNDEALAPALLADGEYAGYVPDLDFVAGFDDEGFANDGSWWRAIRFKSFLGTFWPTNGNRNDVAIRLPAAFYTDDQGQPSRELYKVNLAILEAAMTSAEGFVGDIDRVVEPIDEGLAGVDLDGDGDVGGVITRITRLPEHYAGQASDVDVWRNLYPLGTEFLHSVRYVDPEDPMLLAPRMKELRYSRKWLFKDLWAVQWAYEQDVQNREDGILPQFTGDALHGLKNDFGWSYQAFIEDSWGRLRMQSDEETRFCMGCHGAIGVNVDHAFAFTRKVPGRRGWRFQDMRGIPDVPQHGHADPEVLTYLQRVKGGDEFRANDEMLDRFFPGGVLDEAEVRRAAVGGDQDLQWLIAPSHERALALNKAYKALVEENDFENGRDGVAEPTANVFPLIEGNGTTELGDAGLVFQDGSLYLDWTGVAVLPGDVDGDGDADAADSALIAACATGDCDPVLRDAADQDGDGDIDADDLAIQVQWIPAR